MKSVLITDLDNTLFDWFTVWHKSFSAMLMKTSEISGIEIEVLKPEIKAIHQKYGTAEYSFVLEELPSLQAKYGDRNAINSALDGAIHAFRSERKKNLSLYPTVMDTLKTLKSKGVLVIGYTESKEYYSNYRISKLGLDGIINILFSPEDHTVPNSVERQTRYKLEKTINKNTPLGEIKPNPKILKDIIKSINAKVEDCIYIGDSEMKDISMAQEAGVSDVFAKYGTTHFTNNTNDYNLLRDVTHWTDEVVEYERKIKEEKKDIHANYSIDKFSDILELFSFTKHEK